MIYNDLAFRDVVGRTTRARDLHPSVGGARARGITYFVIVKKRRRSLAIVIFNTPFQSLPRFFSVDANPENQIAVLLDIIYAI